MSEGNKVLENNTDILHKISKEECKDEWFIDKAILCYKAQNEKVFTFFRDNLQKDWLKKYNWCQRPDNTTMSLKRFDHIGNVHGHMSESLAEHYGLEQIDLNTFMHEFVAKLVEELNNLKEIEKSHQEENGKLRVELEQEKNKINTIKKIMSIGDVTDEALFTLVQTTMAELERLEGIEEQLDEEKEKNKKLEKLVFQFSQERDIILKTPVISKDKIKEKLNYQYRLWNTPNRQKEYNQEVVEVLEDLLEEK